MPPFHSIDGAAVMVPSVSYLRVHLTSILTWCTNTNAVIKKTHQHLYFLRKPKRSSLYADVLRFFKICAMESVLTSTFTVWHTSCSVAEEVLQRVKSAQRTIRCSLPSLRDIYTVPPGTGQEPPAYSLIPPLLSMDCSPPPSGRRLCCILRKTSRLKNSFYLHVVRLLSCSSLTPWTLNL